MDKSSKIVATLAILACLIGAFFAMSVEACTAFKTGEQVSGMNKICYYNHLGSQAATTVASYQLCPLTIQIAH